MAEEAPLLPDTAARRRRFDCARRCMYVFDVQDGLGWGIYQSVYSFYLVDVLGMTERYASTTSSTGWAVAALGSTVSAPLLATLSDGVGRRPLFLFACTAQVAQLALLGFLPASTAAWDANMFVLGLLDVTTALSRVIVVDCVDAGFEIGGARDDPLTRGVYALLEDDRATQSTENAYAVAFLYKWVLSGSGQLLGSGLVGYVLLQSVPPRKAISFAGLVRLPCWLALLATLPETAPGGKRSAAFRAAVTEAYRAASRPALALSRSRPTRRGPDAGGARSRCSSGRCRCCAGRPGRARCSRRSSASTWPRRASSRCPSTGAAASSAGATRRQPRGSS
jgi:MFS family permease